MKAPSHHGFTQMSFRRRLVAWGLVTSVLGMACSSKPQGDGIIVVKAPAAGVVKRILASEGIHINQGSPLIEIELPSQMGAALPSAGQAESQAVRGYQAADAEIESARAEAVRHGAEVERLTPLVASGEAPQGQLDGERALSEGAQRRLQQAQEAKRRAEARLLAARQPGLNKSRGQQASPPQVVSAVASSAGTVAVINVRVGEKIVMGQPLATIKSEY